ncbi:precorrin-3B synthase [Pseudochelatococcus lubricantis]|uniref:precorrin-3B synthase n=1 Tax=Pseudochelatococcus lubricantis TaxID=1538102 RepID=UPI0035EF5158
MNAAVLSGSPEPWRRRGACPSLARPMQTGDGLLARLNPAGGELSAAQLAGIAQAALAHGNGLVEITARASLQVRGLTDAGAAAFAGAIAALGLPMRNGTPVETGPLAGLDASALVDPRPLARELQDRAAAVRLAEQLGPKVSVSIDDGGVLPPGATGADIGLEARATESGHPCWRMRTRGRQIEGLEPGRVTTLTLSLLQAIAAKGRTARARDLADSDLAAIAGDFVSDGACEERPSPPPVGVFPLAGGLSAHGVALPFGQTRAENLLAVAQAADAAIPMRLAPGGVLAIGLPDIEAVRWLEAAGRHGLVVGPHDPRLFIHACAGAPACAAAHLDTKALAEAIARQPGLAGDDVRVHLFGCEKRCARPAGAVVTLTGHADGCDIAANGIPLGDSRKATLLDMASLHRTTAPA